MDIKKPIAIHTGGRTYSNNSNICTLFYEPIYRAHPPETIENDLLVSIVDNYKRSVKITSLSLYDLKGTRKNFGRRYNLREMSIWTKRNE
jgi:hypothetical protein